MSSLEPAALQQVLEEYNLSDEDVRRTLSDLLLEKVSTLYFDLKALPAYLELESGVVEDIERDPRLLEEPERRREFLKKWRTIRGAGATYRRLVGALLHMRNRDAAETVCKFVKKFDPGIFV